MTKKERNLKLIGGKWYADWTFGGKRHREFAGYTLAQARNTLVKMKAELLDIARGFKKAEVEDVPFAAFADIFLETYCRPNKRAPERDEISLAHAKAFFEGKTLQAIGAQGIEGYKAARRAEVAPGTVNRELAAIRTLLVKAVEWGKLESNPMAKVRRFKEPAPRERFLTRDEAGRLIDAAAPPLKPILTVALGTGMRRGEILNLKWKDVDSVLGQISITMSKSGKPRKVPMSGAVAEALGAVPRRGEYVFMNGESGQSVTSMMDAFRAACAAAKITGFRFHDCRHTFASRALEAGADLVSVSKILGHSSVAMTAKYLHASGEGQRRAAELMGAFLDPTRQKVDTPRTTEIPTSTVTLAKTDN
ncbi:MAG: site-specific integrase [Candidatus Aminicenantales bacterium]